MAQLNVNSSPFHRALGEYIESRKKDSANSKFLQDLLQEGAMRVTAEDVHQSLEVLEKSNSDKPSTRRVRAFLEPVITVLSDYSGVIDTFAQADPMPTCVIWGCLKAAVEASKRFIGLYEEIESQLFALRNHLHLLKGYEEYFGESEVLQALLQHSYVNVLRFWRRTEKECNRCVFNRMPRGLVSFSTKKLDGVIADIKTDADEISRLVPLISERLQRIDRETQKEELHRAGEARVAQKAFFDQQIREANKEKRRNRLREVREWLIAGQTPLMEHNYRQQERNVFQAHPGTCGWLKAQEIFHQWVNSTTVEESKFWMRSLPGAGKSVVCAATVRDIRRKNPGACCVFQYLSFPNFSFDGESVSDIHIYRCIAEQLLNHLWSQLDDVPEELHAFTQKTSQSHRGEDLKKIIEMLVEHLNNIYVFLDGLDEVCDEDNCWAQVSDTVKYLKALVDGNAGRVRLWCSSQIRSSIQHMLSDFRIFDITVDCNREDIELYLTTSMAKLENLGVDEGTKNTILRDLCVRAEDCFLWAKLMLDSVTKASSLHSVQKIIHESLPRGYDKYYRKKMDSIASEEKGFDVSSLLACLVYAKRPLCLEELCEAIATIDIHDGRNIDKCKRLFKSQVAKSCEPLLQVQETKTAHKTLITFNFCHSSVRSFLLKNAETYMISEQALADICLQYLSQPRYQRFLSAKDDTFIDFEGEDVMEHQLLVYAAKYWDRHFDDLSQENSDKIHAFIRSPQYFNLLQIQSLFVEGQFSPWYDSYKVWAGPQFRRVFPSWLHLSHGPSLQNDYRFFAYEWGELLSGPASVHGKHRGELDRCLWSALGPQHFLRDGKSRYKNFVFAQPSADSTGSRDPRYFEGINQFGNELVVVIMESGDADGSSSRFVCQRWCLNGRSTRLKRSQVLRTEKSFWHLYDRPVSKDLLGSPYGRPSPVSLTPDLRILRIGSCLFAHEETTGYVAINAFEENHDYFEEIASRGDLIALSSRQEAPQEAANASSNESKEPIEHVLSDYTGELRAILEESIKAASESQTAPNTEDAGKSSSRSHSWSSSRTSISSIEVEENEDVIKGLTELSETQDLGEDDIEGEVSDTDDNSAVSSYSEASTAELSVDEDQYNDWDDDVFAVDGNDIEIRSDVSSSGIENGALTELSEIAHGEGSNTTDGEDNERMTGSERLSDDSDIELFGPLGVRIIKRRSTSSLENSEASKQSDAPESDYSVSYAASSDDLDDDESLGSGGAQAFEDIMLGKRGPQDPERARRVRVHVYSIQQGRQKRIFHFSRVSAAGIFASPPVFHQSEPLMVWPLGDQEILFANVQAKTYFTRQLACSHRRSCHVFVKAHFSADGKHLHFAALEAQRADMEEQSKTRNRKGPLSLYLQVTTHRLSLRKLARSPPRLVFRTLLPLDSVAKLHAANPPYTLTWASRYLYLTTCDKDQSLLVRRISLFRDPSEASSSCATICRNQGKFYLPRIEDFRRVHFFPPISPPAPQNTRTRRRPEKSGEQREREPKATIIVGSHSSIPSQRYLAPEFITSPPIGVYLDEAKDLGPWTCKTECVGGDDGGKGQQKTNPLGGRLQSRFETFDRNKDCDIVPYLY